MTTQSTDILALLKSRHAVEAGYLAAGGPGEAGFELLAPSFASDAAALPYGGTRRGTRVWSSSSSR